MPNAWYELDEVKTLGDCIRVNRIKNNLTQEDLAKKVGVDKNTIYTIENNRTCLNVKSILKIEDTLNCSLIGFDVYYDFARNTSINIKQIRLTLNMSTLEFSSLIGVNINTVYKWENGKSCITRIHFKKIMDLNFVY